MSVSVEENAKREDKNNERITLDDGIQSPKWMFWKRRRYIVTAMTFFGFFNVLALRSNVSVAITAMTAKRIVNVGNESMLEEPEFDWDPKLQGLVLGSYFYGYITTQVIGGWLASRIGGNAIFGLGIFVTSLLTFLTPVLARMSVYAFIGIRVLEGIFEGVSYPSMHDVWANWAPPGERNRLATIGYSGSYVGTVVSMTVSGILAERVGWPYVFYVFGVIGVLWYIGWVHLVKRRPENDKCISDCELKYITGNMGTANENKGVVRHPWKKFFSSMPVWAILVVNFAENWGMYTLMTELPTFMKDAFEYNIEDAGLLSAVPHLAVACTIQMAGQSADYLLIKNYLTTTQVRKLFLCAAFLCQSLFMLLTAFLLTPAGSVACLTLAVGLGAFGMAAYFINHLDLSPRHASVLMGICNTAGTLPGIISPTITGYLVSNKTISEWRNVFYITSAIYFVGAIFYGVFGSGERQHWANDGLKMQTASDEVE